MKKKHLILFILFLLTDFNKIQGKTYTLHRSDKTSVEKIECFKFAVEMNADERLFRFGEYDETLQGG